MREKQRGGAGEDEHEAGQAMQGGKESWLVHVHCSLQGY